MISRNISIRFSPIIVIIFLVFIITTGLLLINLFIPKAANGSTTVTLLSPEEGAFLEGNINALAETSASVSKVEFYFIDEAGRYSFVYDANYSGNNQWEYVWITNSTIDGAYKVYAAAVDENNFTYLSEFNTIYVNNGSPGGTPVQDPTNNSNSPSQNENFNTNTGININLNLNTNTTNNNYNYNVPLNENVNINTNIGTNQNAPSNGNVNANLNSNIPPQQDSDNDNLPDKNELQNGTDPNNPDSDKDGLTDGFEIIHGFDPLKDDNATPNRSYDNNIVQDINAAFSSSDPATSRDTDKDGLPDTIEIRLGTDPAKPDTSGDGLTDGFKALNGYSLQENNIDLIVREKTELPFSNSEKVEKATYYYSAIILGILLALVVAILFIFRPKK